MTTVAFLTENPQQNEDGEALTGGGLRSRSLLSALSAVYDVHVVPVPTSDRNLYARHRSLRDAARLRELVGCEPDALHVDGLPLAHAAVGAAEWGIPCVVDVCDSWPLKYASLLRLGRLSVAPGLAAAVALLRSAARASAVAYIAERDRDVDRRLLAGARRTVVVPNSFDETLLTVPLPSRAGSVSSAADWAYPPNADGLAWFLRRVWPLLEESGVQIDLYGPAAPTTELPSRVVYRGWAEQKADIFTGVAVTIAPVRTGAGVKNKVVESLAAGRPVVTTPEGAAGLEDLGAGIVVARSASEFGAAVTRLAGDVEESARLGAAGRAALLAAPHATGDDFLGLYRQR